MRIDRTKLKKSSSEVPHDCKLLIEKLKSCNENDLLIELKKIKAWNYGKCELYHWIDVLDLFDSILERGVCKERENQWALPCDQESNEQHKELLIHIVVFTALLIEHSFSRHLYNSMEHLTTLLSSSDMQIVLAVLNLLYVFSKRSNFITRLSSDRRQLVIQRLSYLAESWGGKENGFGLAECCQDLPMSSFPTSATTLHFEFYGGEVSSQSSSSSIATIPKNNKLVNTLNVIHVDCVDQVRDGRSLAKIMEDLVEMYNVPKCKQMLLFTHLRLAHSFSNYRKRLQCVQARLQALSIIVYCNAMSVQENTTSILYNGFIEELVDVLELKSNRLLDIKAAALRTLTSVIHLDHNSKLSTIIDVTGASSYHGFLPSLVRSCIQALIDANTESFPLPFATALFSFLYHLASYENGGESLVSCGMIESLLKVIGWRGSDPEHITFVTRAVRVIDLITNLDMNSFQSHNGLNIFINRLETEVEICRKEQPFVIETPNSARHGETHAGSVSDQGRSADETSSSADEGQPQQSPMDVDTSPKPSTSNSAATTIAATLTSTLGRGNSEIQCYAQRAALLKSMLNFLKKAIQDSAFSDSIRHLMDGNLPSSLRHIISNAEYYGPSLFMLATDVVTVYVFQEPSLLSSLQESGLTDVVLHALLIKDVPATREVLASLPNVFSALCLNSRGLEAFVACKPFERVFKVLLSVDYLPAMRRRRSSDPLGDTASNLGNAMDELMRHQPSLRADATAAIINLLTEVCNLGTNPNYFCSKSSKGLEGINAVSDSRITDGNRNDGGSSDEEEEEDEDTAPGAASSQESSAVQKVNPQQPSTSTGQLVDKQPVPLVDYILNVMRFVDAILSNNSTDDHCREFVKQKGLTPLLRILQLPNLPIDFPMSPACLAVASVSKSILTLAHEREVLKEALRHLTDVLVTLEPLQKPLDPPGGSVLLEELVNATAKAPSGTDPFQSSVLTPLLHSMSAAHAYIIMFVHVCRTGQTDIRHLSVTHWGTDVGIEVLRKLSELYTSLVWESTVLLALCSEATANATWQFGRHQLEKLSSYTKETVVTTPTEDGPTATMEVDEASVEAALPVASSSSRKKESKSLNKLSPQVKLIKPLLSSASRLGRALAELFGLLVKLSVGSPLRHRRSHHPMPTLPIAPSPPARAVAVSLTKLLTRGLSWEPPETSPIPKFRLTFYICSVGFTSPMLFDERKHPYHLMLQHFVQSGGQDAFFKTFKWALSQGGKFDLSEGIEHPDLPDGTGEFLDSWLMLLEKMVNPKMILESPHALPTKTSSTSTANIVFDPVKYLIQTQKKAFECVMHLWNKKPIKTYGERMSESVLAILCHLLKGETIIAEKLAKEKEPEPSDPAVAGRGAPVGRRNELEEQGINSEHLQQLQDMGFSREMALEALMQTTSLEQATDYLLAHPQPLSLDVPMSDEDQINRAIEMSLGAAESSSTEAHPSEDEDEPMSKQMMDDFTKDILPGCLRLLDTLPETVYRVCDLLIAVAQRNGDDWMKRILKQLIEEISRNVIILSKATEPMTSSDKRSISDWAAQLTQIPEASKAATRIHVFSLLFEEKRNECASLIKETDLIDNLIQLLEATQNTMSILSANSLIGCAISTPKWLAPVILLVDLFDKAAIASIRKAPLVDLQRRSWRWFDERTGKWTTYTPSNNKIIDDAYKAGESYIRFAAGRRKYTVQFCTMVQINEETGNWRPIMFVNDDKAMEVSEEAACSSVKSEFKVITGIEQHQASTLIKACVGFIAVPVEPDTLHAVLRLCLRLTRNYEQASLFAESGGIKSILKLTQTSAFTGFNSLATLITRHVLEEPVTLKQTMEKVIRSTTHHSPVACKEMHYILRVLGPAACRDSALFVETVKNTLRISLPTPITKREDEDTRLLGANAVQMLKLTPPKTTLASPPKPIIISLLNDLLNSLTVKSISSPTTEEPKDPIPVPDAPVAGPSVVADTIADDGDDDSETVELAPVLDPKVVAAKEEEIRKNRLLMSQSSLLRLLAELARSYTVVAKLITEHVYHPGLSDLITEETGAIAFILDHLLPSTQTVGDKDCPALARVLIAALASCVHCPEAQQILVNEVKSALHRALVLVESNEKHSRIQAITSIINTMIESCPAVSPTLPGSQARPPPNALNNVVKIMLKKGVVSDLARVTHSLDLSSPHMAMTVNSALKPLETLSRIINQPNVTMAVQAKKPKTSQETSTTHQEAMEEDNVTSEEIREALALVRDRIGQESDGVNNTASGAEGVAPDSGTAVTTETSTSDTNAYADVTVDDGTDNEANIEDGPLDFYSEPRHLTSRGTMMDDDLRNESMVEGSDEAHRDNIANANGAESESGDESNSSSESEDAEDEDDDDDEEEDDESDQEEQVGVEDEEDQVEDEDEDAEDEDEDGSAYVDTDELEDVIGRFDRERDPYVFDIEEMLPPSVLQESGFTLRSMIPLLESDNHVAASETAQPSVPPAPGNVSVAHPLLVRHSDVGSAFSAANSTNAERILATRTHGRTVARSRLSRYTRAADSAGGVLAANHHNWHMPLGHRAPNPPVILQRLLGTTTAQDFLQLTGGVNSNNAARVIFASNEFQIIAADEDLLELHESGPYAANGSSSSSALGSIPSAMIRWTEESRVLDGDSMHDCVSSLKNEIIEFFEKLRDEEIAERKEKRKKMIEDEKKATDEEEKRVKERNDKKSQENSEEGSSSAGSEVKVENESTVNATTERLAESIVEQVLGPVMVGAGGSNSIPQLPSEAESRDQVMENPVQNDNEITEMEASTDQVAMDVNGTDQEFSVPPRISEATITPEDLSTISNTSAVEDQVPVNNGNADQESTSAPEPNNTVEVVNSDSNSNSQEAAAAAESSSAQDSAVPEELDPSFLAALPDNIRAEVIAEHQEERRRRAQARETRTTGASAVPIPGTLVPSTNFSEVSEEFLAALPPNIQEEVLAQQRAEQERAAAAAANPTDPVDPANFITSLPPSLRRQVLADMDDSLLALLPPDLSSEAQNLRTELEQRHRQIQERFFTSHAGSALSRILRSAAGRVGNTRYAIHTVPGTSNWPWNIGNTRGSSLNPSSASYRVPPTTKVKGRQLLDHEALSCILILLFVDEPKLNVGRLHRVLRNLSHHPGTRQWIIQSLLTIMERTRECREVEGPRSKKSATQKVAPAHQVASWLSISLDAALGCKTNVFQIQRNQGGKKITSSSTSCQVVTIHPQAAPLVSRHVLDALISLAKAFPHQFLTNSSRDYADAQSSQLKEEQPFSGGKLNKDADFWDVLVKLDSLSTTKKGKNVLRSHSSNLSLNSSQSNDTEAIDGDGNSPLGSIINLLSHPVVKRSAQLTDRLLRLLSLIAIALPTHPDSSSISISTSAPAAPSSSRNRRGQQQPQAVKPPEPDKIEGKVTELSDKAIAVEEQLKLAVDVLTSKSCSEEGLEDVTSLLLRLSRSCPKTRDMVLKLLLDGARTLGFTVCGNIESLINELRELNLKAKADMGESSDAQSADKNVQKGMVMDRFTNQSVVITAPSNVKHALSSKEVQLPSMGALTSKTSSQNFFLRILKVIIQLRDSIRVQRRKTTSQAASLRQLEQLQQEVSSMADALSAVADAVEAGTNQSQPQSMEVDNVTSTEASSSALKEEKSKPEEPDSLSVELALDKLWDTLSLCLLELADAPDHHAVLVLQPAVEAFFLVHASEKAEANTSRHESQLASLDIAPGSPLTSDLTDHSTPSLPPDTRKFLQFAETHKVVLNQILRQSTTPLVDGPFAVLVDHTRVLDFDVKRRYFRQELERLDDGSRREDLAVHVRREHVFEDSFRELYRRTPEDWKNRFYIVFEGEEGQDAGGLLREWYTIISREIFNPNYALFTTSPGDRVTYMINSASHCNSNHLQYFKFVGRVIAKAVYDNKLLECYFTRSFYKHILGKPVKYTDMESEDYSFYQGLVFLLEHDIKELGYELTFSLELQEFGVTEVRDLKPNGRNIPVLEENKQEYVRLVCQEKMTSAIRKQLDAFLDGFYEIIPKRLISIFNEQETELLISGLPNIDIDDLKSNTEYHKYQATSLQIQWFWRALRSFDQADRAKFLQFVTGTSKVPLQGFATLEGMNGTQKFQIHRDDRSTDRLPSAHTCFNQLDLPAYETYDKLRAQMLKAVRECSEGFGFA